MYFENYHFENSCRALLVKKFNTSPKVCDWGASRLVSQKGITSKKLQLSKVFLGVWSNAQHSSRMYSNQL